MFAEDFSSVSIQKCQSQTGFRYDEEKFDISIDGEVHDVKLIDNAEQEGL